MVAGATGSVMVLLGLLLAAGGGWLLWLGGSWAYLLIGAGLMLAGAMVWRRHPAALGAYAGLLAGTAGWALWEVGLDRWQLIPRGALLAVLALWLLTPWVADALRRDRSIPSQNTAWPLPRLGLALVTVACVAVALASLRHDSVVLSGLLPRAGAATPLATGGPALASDDWTAYGGTAMGQRYSALRDITPETAGRLKPAWTFHTGDMKGQSDPSETTFQVTPLKIGDTLYLCTPHSIVIALDAASGAERWRHDPKVRVGKSSQHLTCRGLGYHDGAGGQAGGAVAAAPCARRLFLPTIDARLIALDPATGERCTGFADQGVLQLSGNMPHLAPGSYMQTSPPVVTRDLVVVGSSINDNVREANPSGVIRAFDVRTGKLVWNWHAATPEATAPLAPGELYPAGGPNMWSVASADEALGLVYLPMANRSPDLLARDRPAQARRFTASITALELATGQVRWVFQGIHNDLWDRDMPSQPVLVDLTLAGQRVPALVAPTKQGDLYILDRRTGQPLYPVEERPVPTDGTPGEPVSPTQPFSSVSLMPPPLAATDMWGATLWDQLLCRIRFHEMRYDGPYTPPTTTTSLVYPGNTGVFNWGSVAVDPVREVLVGAPMRLAFTHRLVPRDDPQAHLVSDGVEPFNENYGGRYAFDMGPFTSALGLPCQAPPWGLRAGVDLRTGKVAWQHRNGTARDSFPVLPLPLPMGVPGMGGPLLTAGGVMFYSGTLDQYLRAFDTSTGEQLWQARLSAGGQATPITYRANGRQMVVVAAGGHGTFGTRIGDAVHAFVLE
jgi:quinoprotein glucose dehydrogenase